MEDEYMELIDEKMEVLPLNIVDTLPSVKKKSQYYKLDTGKVITCETKISPEMWEKKQILPYRKTTSDNKGDVGVAIGEQEVVQTFYKAAKPELTIDELKQVKINSSEKACKQYVYSVYSQEKQLSALAGVYSPEECEFIREWCKKKIIDFRAWREHLNSLTTLEDINGCNWMSQEINEETGEIISETFWEAE